MKRLHAAPQRNARLQSEAAIFPPAAKLAALAKLSLLAKLRALAKLSALAKLAALACVTPHRVLSPRSHVSDLEPSPCANANARSSDSAVKTSTQGKDLAAQGFQRSAWSHFTMFSLVPPPIFFHFAVKFQKCFID